MGDLVAEMATTYDVVILDAPPTLPVTDAAVLAKWMNGVIVVAFADRVKKPQVAATVQTLKQVDAKVLGFVVNGLEGRRSGGYGYGYGYTYKESSDASSAPGFQTPVPAPARADIPTLDGKLRTVTILESTRGSERNADEGNRSLGN